MAPAIDINAARDNFPALHHKQIYFDNAGGSQVLQSAIDSISSYLGTNNVQLGASYPIGRTSTSLYTAGVAAVAKHMHTSPENIVLGPSTTQLFRNASLALFDHVTPGSEIIVSILDHEANIAPWVQLASWRQANIKWWAPSGANPRLEPDALRASMTDRTKLVTCTHSSNILGTLTPVAAIADVVHEVPGALLAVDGVAYAPHGPVDVAGLGVDLYAFSWYKVYGPHIASLYASARAQEVMVSLGHFFKGRESLENMLGLAAANYELTASIPAVCEYLDAVSWDAVAEREERLQRLLLEYLSSKDGITIYGERTADRKVRVPVVSFTVEGRSSRSIVEGIQDRSDFGCRWGSFYCNRLITDVLGLDPGDGVVRVSLLHYNTEEEVRKFVKVLDGVLSE